MMGFCLKEDKMSRNFSSFVAEDLPSVFIPLEAQTIEYVVLLYQVHSAVARLQDSLRYLKITP